METRVSVFFSEKIEARTVFELISKQNKCKFFGYQTKCEYFAGFSCLNLTLVMVTKYGYIGY